MSIVRCEDCATPIDTDHDVDGWIEELGADYCPKCREQHWAELDQAAEAAA